MDSAIRDDPNPPLKSLGLLGRDEMNLAEFPITLLTDRVPKDQKEAIYQDEIYDERTGRTLARRLTIQAGNYGLTTAVDDEIILALIQITKQNNNFTNKKIYFTRHELIKTLNWQRTGASYERILLSLRKWTSVYLDYENAWRDNRAKAWLTKGFHIIDSFEFNDSRVSGDQLDLIPSYIVWNEVIFESFQAGYLKPLDYDLCMGLSNSTAKRMYRFLDKRFHHKPDWTFGLKELAQEHIGLSRNYDGPAHLRRKLRPAIEELERVGFLEPLAEADRFSKQGSLWMVRFRQQAIPSALPLFDQSSTAKESETSTLAMELTSRGVTRKTAAELVERYQAEAITAKIEEFDFLVARQDQKVSKSPAGYLVKSINDDYAQPKGFVSKAERERQAEAKRQKEEDAAASRRQQREQEAADKAERQRINAYRKELTSAQLAEHEAEAIAQASEAMRQTLDQTQEPKIRRMLVGSMVDEHIRQLLLKATEPA